MLRVKVKACVLGLVKRTQSAKQREQPEEAKIAGNQTKHEAALPLGQARAAESPISYLRITGSSAVTPRFFGRNHQAERWAARYSSYAARYRSTSLRSK